MPAYPHLGLTATAWLAGPGDVLDEVEVLPGLFREGLAQRNPDQVVPADGLAELLVGELEDEVRAGHVGHPRGQPQQEIMHQRELARAAAERRSGT